MLPEPDRRHLDSKGQSYEVTLESGMICLILPNYPLPDGYEPRDVTLLLRLPAGYPDAAPDMYWCDPPVRLSRTGAFPQAAESMENHLGRTWQRFSRHLGPGAWRPGDGLDTYLTLIRHDLERSA
jgi:hypothetical protein